MKRILTQSASQLALLLCTGVLFATSCPSTPKTEESKVGPAQTPGAANNSPNLNSNLLAVTNPALPGQEDLKKAEEEEIVEIDKAKAELAKAKAELEEAKKGATTAQKETITAIETAAADLEQNNKIVEATAKFQEAITELKKEPVIAPIPAAEPAPIKEAEAPKQEAEIRTLAVLVQELNKDNSFQGAQLEKMLKRTTLEELKKTKTQKVSPFTVLGSFGRRRDSSEDNITLVALAVLAMKHKENMLSLNDFIATLQAAITAKKISHQILTEAGIKKAFLHDDAEATIEEEQLNSYKEVLAHIQEPPSSSETTTPQSSN